MIRAAHAEPATIRARTAGVKAPAALGVPWLIGCLALAAAIGLVIATASLKVFLFLVAVAIGAVVCWLKPEVALYAVMAAVIVTTEGGGDELPSFGGLPAIEDLKLMQGVPPVTVAMLLGLFAIYFGKRLLVERRASVVPLKYLALYGAAVACGLSAGIVNGTPFEDIKVDLLRFVYPALCFYLCANLLDDRRKIAAMIGVVFAACAVRCGVLDVNYLTGHGESYDEGTVVTMDSAVLMAAGVMVSIGCALAVQPGRSRHFPALVLAALPMLFALVFSFRRGHWVGQFAALALLFLWATPAAKKRLAVAGTALALAAALGFAFLGGSGADAGGSSLLTRVESIFDPAQHSNQHHYQEAVITLHELAGRPLMGMGLGGKHAPVPGDWREEDQPLQVVHNTFIYIWMKLGLPGLCLFLWGLIAYLGRLDRYRRSARFTVNRAYVAGIGSGAGIWLAMFMIGPVPWYLHQTFLIALFAALSLNMIRLDERGAQAPSRSVR